MCRGARGLRSGFKSEVDALTVVTRTTGLFIGKLETSVTDNCNTSYMNNTFTYYVSNHGGEENYLTVYRRLKTSVTADDVTGYMKTDTCLSNEELTSSDLVFLIEN